METYEERGGSLIWQNRQGPWAVTVTCDLSAPFDGPGEVRVWFSPDPDNPAPDVDAAIASDGIPTTLIRSIPLAEIRAHARELRGTEAIGELEAIEAEMSAKPVEVPARMRTEADYIRLAQALAQVRASGEKSPQAALAARLGIGKATMSERVKKARELGLWDGREVTPKAHEVLEQEVRNMIERAKQDP
ncbi:hypothetical protein ACIA78_27380 [Streptomyces xanthochromogenes]|uniref:hypothetical protein n=1 Tax=Streptomyces xanthochromogenes TaxID=67384 RepID=UPI0037AB8E1B